MRQCQSRSPLRGPSVLTRDGKRRWNKRPGAIIVLTAILLVLMMGMLALSVDVGYMYTLESQLQRSVDAAALAGAGALIEGQDVAQDRVAEYLVRNPIGGEPVVSGGGDLGSQIDQFQSEHGDDLEVKLGHWNADTRTFNESNQLPSTISVSMTYPNNPLFFARFLGEEEFSITASSVAMYQPRDIMVVLDFSASMNDDTEFKAIPTLGRDVVEANLAQCWQELGSPTYGSLALDPQYMTVHGQPASGEVPHIAVEYRYKSVYITSTKDLSNVVLEFSNGARQQIEGLAGYTGIFQGTGANAGRPIYKVWVKSGNNDSGEGPGYGEPFPFYPNMVDALVEETFGLNDTPYPYAGGSWDGYIDWCQEQSGQNAVHGGYHWMFGYKSLMVYWLEKYPRHTKVPDLWKVSAQPAAALKNATDVFMDFIQEVDTDDRVGLAIYNAPDGEGYLESGLTQDFESLANLVLQRQAGHYHDYTNIGGGLHAARVELEDNGRPGAFKMVVLMTDGKANWVSGNYDEVAAKQYVLSEAQLCADSRYPVLTVSLGADADTSLMQQVADLTPKGKHFNIAGGQTGDEYYEDLLDVFKEIAKDRPLKLVK